MVFPTFFNLILNFAKRCSWSEPSIVSSQSCFCWRYRTSPSLAMKNIINLILVLTIWWCPCVEWSLVLFEEGVCYAQFILLQNSSPLHCFILYSKAKLACYFRYLLNFLLLHSSPLWWKWHLFWGIVLEGLGGLELCGRKGDSTKI